MRRITVTIMVALAMSTGLCLCVAGTETDRNQQADRVAWVAKCLAEFMEIKPGMTRAEIEKRMQKDGGIQSYVTVRYLHPECSYFKLDVEFSVKRNPDDQNRLVPSADDKAVKVSRPYIENPYID